MRGEGRVLGGRSVHRACRPGYMYSMGSTYSSGKYGLPVASATSLMVTLPSITLMPWARAGSARAAATTPESATAMMYGSVALVSASVEVMGTTPAMLSTQ